MHAGVDAVLFANLADKRFIANIALVEGNVCRDGLSVAPAKIVKHDNTLSTTAQCLDKTAAYVAGAASDEDCISCRLCHRSHTDIDRTAVLKRYGLPMECAGKITILPDAF